MSDIHKVIISGRLTRDPELRSTPGGKSVCHFSVASNRKFKDASGDLIDATVYIDCTAWAAIADNIKRYFSRGKKILIEGNLIQDRWEDKATGKPRTKHVVLVAAWYFAEGKGEDPKLPPTQEPSEDIDDNIPF